MDFRLAHLQYPWPILKDKVKVMHFSTENVLEMVKEVANIAIAIKSEDACKGFRLVHLHLTLSYTQRSKSW